MKHLAFLAIALLASPTWAINKCIGPDGKVVFQDAPCAGKGETINVQPASGHAPKTVPAATTAGANAAPATVANTAPANKKEGAFGESWQRRTYLENRGVADARAATDNHQRECAAQQVALASRKRIANNNLAGATWEQSISAEMQAAATMCDSRSRELRAELEALQKELRELQAKQ
ncbi:hypothetical protein CBP34_15480 [Acidovorax carolinensis]|uniref:DUF4124 domain-containing protein n=1 Tax=Acidovorax carolinensis TaxID=553814 RepID=A0A240U4N0_9BURK|nr:hypothetical protein [Acidovorax carolinensis]ART52786.1 hypothetical protein CBP34_15480 [Acidovorax carolinensis]